MKYIFAFIIMIPLVATAQREPGRLYLGVMLHDLDNLGGSAIYSFGPAKYIGIGAGIEATGYRGNSLIPVFADIRARHEFGLFEPFVGIQAGYPFMNGRAKMEDGTTYRGTENVSGQFLFGGTAGSAISLGKVGLFLSYTFRTYRLNYYERGEDGYIETPGMSIVSVGIRF